MIESNGSIIAENIINGIKLLLGSHNVLNILLLINVLLSFENEILVIC